MPLRAENVCLQGKAGSGWPMVKTTRLTQCRYATSGPAARPGAAGREPGSGSRGARHRGRRAPTRWRAPERRSAGLRRVSLDARLDDLVWILHRLAALDLVDVLHARRHLAPDRILVVEERGIVEAYEELAVAGIRAGGARHRS